MRADDVIGIGLDAGEIGEVDEFGDGAWGDVEGGEETGAGGSGAGEGAYFQEVGFLVGGVDACGFADDGRAKNDCFPAGCGGGHLGNEGDVVFSGLVSEVDGPAGDAAAGGMEGRVRVRCLEHVPVGQDVEVGGKEGVVGICEEVPRMGGGDFGEEVVGVADHEAGFVGWEL